MRAWSAAAASITAMSRSAATASAKRPSSATAPCCRVAVDVGDDALLGVLSAPASGQTLPDNERWLGRARLRPAGHPAGPEFQRQRRPISRPARPGAAARISDAIRVLLPGVIATAALILFVTLPGVCHRLVADVGRARLTVPLLTTVLALAAICVRRRIKRLLIGHLRAHRTAAVVPLRVEQRDRQRHLRGHRRVDHAAAARHAVRAMCLR